MPSNENTPLGIDLAAAAFGDFDRVQADRLSPRVETPPVEEEPYDEEFDAPPEPTRPPRNPAIVWSFSPSVQDQVHRHPESVRPTETTTAVLDLSRDADIMRWNDIQRQHMAAEPTMIIHESDRQFWEGKYLIYVTFSKLQYQQL